MDRAATSWSRAVLRMETAVSRRSWTWIGATGMPSLVATMLATLPTMPTAAPLRASRISLML